MNSDNKNALPRAGTPEEVGVSSEAILKMIEDIEASGAYEHGFMIIRNGKVAFESYRHPYSASAPHCMYSVSKAVTSSAIGFAIDEGYLTLETKLLDIFPEYRPAKYDKDLEATNILHLLSMQAGMKTALLTNKTKDRWMEDFFEGKREYSPGEKHSYINENIFLLCAILVRVTGIGVNDYLTPRLWEPLGINKPFWETDPKGIEAGGWGIHLSAEDLAKFILCYMQEGEYDGKQVVPKEWAKKAVLNHEKFGEDRAPDREGGYGLCFFRTGEGIKSFRAEGMFSQLGIGFEDYNAVFVTVGGDIEAGRTHKYIFDNFPKGFIDPNPEASPNPKLLEAKKKRETIKTPKQAPRSALEKTVNGKTIKFKHSKFLKHAGFPMSILPLATTYMSKQRAGEIDDISFRFYEDFCTFYWREKGETNRIRCGFNGQYL
ncbi:MAG TPA: serine hydrolase, partial [Clostridiales bacterium]|nr:serine hydrolase [Clostridiales bacterium]